MGSRGRRGPRAPDRRLFECSPVATALVGAAGTERCRILELNPAFAELVGRSRRALVGESACELLHPDERERGTEALANLIAGLPAVFHGDARLMRSDGTSRAVRVSARLLRDKLGRAETVLIHAPELSDLHHPADWRDQTMRRRTAASDGRLRLHGHHILDLCIYKPA